MSNYNSFAKDTGAKDKIAVEVFLCFLHIQKPRVTDTLALCSTWYNLQEFWQMVIKGLLKICRSTRNSKHNK